MIKKILMTIGLGTTFDIASLLSSDKINELAGKEVIERGFPFSYLEKAENSISAEAPQTEFIFSNATYNLIFWIAVSAVIVYVLFWVIGKFSKLVFMASLAAIAVLIILAFTAA